MTIAMACRMYSNLWVAHSLSSSRRGVWVLRYRF